MRRSTRYGRTWSHTAATSSCSASRTTSHACACRASCSGCAASQATLELAIKQALDEHAPDLAGLEVEGVAEPETGGVELPLVHAGGNELPARRNGNGGGPSWVALDGANGLEAGGLRRLDAGGVALVVANVDGSLLAYRNACAACGAAAGRRRARRSDAALHRVRRRVRPAPRRARGRERAASARTGPAARRRRDPGGRVSGLEDMKAARRRAGLVARMRTIAQANGESSNGAPRAAPEERCDLCGAPMPDDHRHLLHLEERRISVLCEPCWALHSGDPEYRPAGMRTVWLEDFECPDEVWASFQIPIGLAFFMRSSTTGGVVAFYPSPAGATESELDLDAWDAFVQANPRLGDLEPDGEALIVNRLADAPQYVIAPIDDCYRLVGLIKSHWEGISGGSAIERAVPEFFVGLRSRAVVVHRDRAMNAQPEPAAVAVPAPELTVLSAAHEPHAAAPTMVFGLAVHDACGTRRLHGRPHRPGPDRPGQARLRRRDAAAPPGAVRPARSGGGEHPEPGVGAGGRARALVSGVDDGRAARAVHLRPRGRDREVLQRARRRRCAPELPLHGNRVLPRPRGLAPAGADPLGHERRVQDAGGGVAGDDRRALSGGRLDPARTRTRSAGCRRGAPSGVCRASTPA